MHHLAVEFHMGYTRTWIGQRPVGTGSGGSICSSKYALLALW